MFIFGSGDLTWHILVQNRRRNYRGSAIFDKLIRELHRLERPQRLPIAIQTDTDDYLDRQCPSAECEFVFKVYNEDWRDKVRDEEVYCPFCGHTDTSGRWGTEEQVKHQRETAITHARRRLGRAMKRDPRGPDLLTEDDIPF